MRQRQLEHLIRAATNLLNSSEVIVIGSQSILGSHKDTTLPEVLTLSIEVDFLPISGNESDADRIDGAIGEGSQFHETFGVYAEGVSPSTAVLAPGWRERLIPLPDPASGAVGLCLDPHDLCASKLIAGRPKDLAFVEAAVSNYLVDPLIVEDHLKQIEHLATDSAIAAIRRLASAGISAQRRPTWRANREQAIRDRRRRIKPGSPELGL